MKILNLEKDLQTVKELPSMLCQNCQLNEATIHLYTNVNGVKKQNDLCQNCYQIMKSGGPTNLFGGGANPSMIFSEH